MKASILPTWMAQEVAEYDLDLAPPPRTILDIGANIGAFSLHYSNKWPAAIIDAYEPVEQNYLLLSGNVAGNDRIHIHGGAVRSFTGPDEIFLGDLGVTCSFHQRGRQTQTKVKVDCIAAGSLAPADLVKIDTEGCEVEIIRCLNLSATRALVVEYHSLDDQTVICDLLRAQGFVLLAHEPGSHEHGVLKFARPDAGVSLPQPSTLNPLSSHRKVYLAVASHFSVNDVLFVQSLLHLAARPTVSVAFGWSCDPSVERARNILTANFLESDCTHILFVDSDIGFIPEDVWRIASHEEPVVGGIYPLKNMQPEVQWCGNGLSTTGPQPSTRPDGLMPVKYIGTGFLCLARSVLEKFQAAHPELFYEQDFAPHRTECAFWHQGVHSRRFLTEDWMFCQLWLDLGGSIFADTAVMLKHAGRAEWPLPLQKGNPFAQPSTLNPQPV